MSTKGMRVAAALAVLVMVLSAVSLTAGPDQTDAGTSTVMNEDQLREAVSLGNDILIGADIDITADGEYSPMIVSKSISVNMNSFKVTLSGNAVLFKITNGASLSIRGDSTSVLTGGICVGVAGIDYENETGSLSIMNGTYKPSSGTVIFTDKDVAENCDITAGDAVFTGGTDMFALAGPGTFQFNNCTVSGSAGFILKAGSLTLDSCNIHATAGEAVKIDADAETKEVSLKIKGSSYNEIRSDSSYAVYDDCKDTTLTSSHSIKIESSRFYGSASTGCFGVSDNFTDLCVFEITGGSFSDFSGLEFFTQQTSNAYRIWCSFDQSEIVEISSNLSIYLEDSYITSTQSAHILFSIWNDSTLNISGTGDFGTTGIISVGDITKKDGENSVKEVGKLVINGGTYTAKSAGDSILIVNSGVLKSSITVNNATLSSNANTIYINNPCTCKLTGCTVNGYTGLYLKKGDVSLNSCTVNADGAYRDPVSFGRGMEPTGDAVIIDRDIDTKANISLEIVNNTKLESANAYALRDTYMYSPAGTETYPVHEIEISSGTLIGSKGTVSLSDDFRQYLSTRSTVFTVNGGSFSDLSCLEYITYGAQYTLVADCSLSSSIEISKNVTLIVNGFEVDSGNLEYMFRVKNNATMYIEGDSGSELKGRISVGSTDSDDERGNLEIIGGKYSSVGGESVIFTSAEVNANSTISVSEAELSSSGFVFDLAGLGTSTVKDCKITGSTAFSVGNGKLITQGCEVKATDRCFVFNEGTAEVRGGSFSDLSGLESCIRPWNYILTGSDCTGDIIVPLGVTLTVKGQMIVDIKLVNKGTIVVEGTMVIENGKDLNNSSGTITNNGLIDDNRYEGASVTGTVNKNSLASGSNAKAWIDDEEDKVTLTNTDISGGSASSGENNGIRTSNIYEGSAKISVQPSDTLSGIIEFPAGTVFPAGSVVAVVNQLWTNYQAQYEVFFGGVDTDGNPVSVTVPFNWSDRNAVRVYFVNGEEMERITDVLVSPDSKFVTFNTTHNSKYIITESDSAAKISSIDFDTKASKPQTDITVNLEALRDSTTGDLETYYSYYLGWTFSTKDYTGDVLKIDAYQMTEDVTVKSDSVVDSYDKVVVAVSACFHFLLGTVDWQTEWYSEFNPNGES